MPNLAGVLRDEVRRLARKEIKAELAATRKASAQYRRDIALLKRQLRSQAKQITSLERAARRGGKAGSEGNGGAQPLNTLPDSLRATRQATSKRHFFQPP